MIRFCLLLSLAFCAAHSCFAAEHASLTEKQIAEILEPIRTAHDLPALAAAVVTSDGATVVAAVGVRKRGDDTAATRDDKFHLGSCTKAMTSTLLGRYVERGKLKWDDTLAKLFPSLSGEMTDEAKAITLAQLLGHVSGIPDLPYPEYVKLAASGNLREQRFNCLRFALQQVKKDGLASEPGKKFSYSNLGYIIAAAALEQQLDKDWEEIIAEEIFTPLGMASAGNGSMATPPDKIDQPWSHWPDGNPSAPGPDGDNATPLGPAGRVHSTLADWGKFVVDQMNEGKQVSGLPKPLLKPETYQRLHTPEFEGSTYAIGGWGRAKTDYGPMLGHDGSNLRNYCSGVIFLDRGVAILVACNQGPNDDPKGDGKAGCHEARAAIEKLLFAK